MFRCVHLLGMVLALLAAGCCLPRLGGRCDDRQCPETHGPETADAKAPAKALAGYQDLDASKQPRQRLAVRDRHGRLRPWHRFRPGALGTPPGQVVPLPRFHPVPVRPVFEPQFDYALPQLLEPYLGPIDVAPPAAAVPTPAPPTADPPAEPSADRA